MLINPLSAKFTAVRFFYDVPDCPLWYFNCVIFLYTAALKPCNLWQWGFKKIKQNCVLLLSVWIEYEAFLQSLLYVLIIAYFPVGVQQFWSLLIFYLFNFRLFFFFFLSLTNVLCNEKLFIVHLYLYLWNSMCFFFCLFVWHRNEIKQCQ